MADRSPLRIAMDEAYELHALYLGAQAEADKASDKGSKDRTRLKSKYDADLAKIDEAEAQAAAGVNDAREALERRQRELQDEFHAGLDLLQVRQGASTRL